MYIDIDIDKESKEIQILEALRALDKISQKAVPWSSCPIEALYTVFGECFSATRSEDSVP